jgi:hypothetical protein
LVGGRAGLTGEMTANPATGLWSTSRYFAIMIELTQGDIRKANAEALVVVPTLSEGISGGLDRPPPCPISG